MALPFVYREAEPARQAIAQLQLEAAIAENASRERIAKEQTAASRYATQSQLSENEKNRAVTREDIASRERSRTGTGVDAASRERGNIQYQTILGEISESDPMTKRELEARIAANPQISEDLANNLRSARDRAYKIAKDNYAAGEQLAKSYRSELLGKKPGDTALDDIYKRMTADKNTVFFDRATGNVQSLFRAPREDAAVAPPTASSISPAQDYGGAGASAGSSTVPTIAEMQARAQARVTGTPAGISPAQDYGGASAPSTRASLGQPTQEEILSLFDQFPSAVPGGAVELESYQQGGRTGQRRRVINPAAALSGFSSNLSASIPRQRPESAALLGRLRDSANDYSARLTNGSTTRIPRVSDLAAPAAPSFAIPMPIGPAEMQGPAYRASPPDFMDNNEAYRPEMLGPPYRPEVREAPQFMDFSDPVREPDRYSGIAPRNMFGVNPALRPPAMSEMMGPFDAGRPQTSTFSGLPRVARTPYWGPTTDMREEELQRLVGITQRPEFSTFDPEYQQYLLDEIGNYAQRLPSRNRSMFPRTSDMQRLRPEYVPMDDYLAPR